jgi:hypothetical protein
MVRLHSLLVATSTLIFEASAWPGYNASSGYAHLREGGHNYRRALNFSSSMQGAESIQGADNIGGPIRGPDDSSELLGDLLLGGPFTAVGQVREN